MLESEIIISVIVGFITSLGVWYLTNFLMGPKFKIEDCKFDEAGQPHVTIRNKSRFFNAYDMTIYCFRYNGNINVDYSNSYMTRVSITRKSVLKVAETYLQEVDDILKDDSNEVTQDKSLEVFIMGYNRLGTRCIGKRKMVVPKKTCKHPVRIYINDDNY